MSLQDEHLKQALQSAPDKDLAPSDAVRQKVLDYAKSTSPKHEGWFKTLLNRFNAWQINSWQLVGMSTIASVFLVMIMVRPELPSDAVWVDASEQEIAQVDEVEPEGANTNSAPEITLALPNDDALFAPIVTDDLDASLEGEQTVEATPILRKEVKKKVMTKREANKVDLENTSEPITALSDEGDSMDAASAPAPAPAREPVAIAQAEAEVEEEAVVADKAVSATASRMESRGVAASTPSNIARKSVSPVNKAITGAALAKQDIQAGNLRLLFIGDTWPAGKSLVDDETGFRVESASHTSLPEAEVERYNQTMRDWYLVNHDLTTN